MLCSLYDTLVPMCVHGYRYAFVVFVSDGPFVHFSDLGQLALSVRCGFITVTYAILHAHFIFRYFVLYKNALLQKWFMPYGLVATFVYCVCHMALWTWVCEFFFYGDYERKRYVHDSFKGLYHEDSLNMTMVVALYWEGSNDAVIIKKLKVQSSLSEKTINLQRQLFNALAIQTVIPICVSLMPCLAVWFGPVFLLDFRWVYLSAVIAVSIFPSIDPIALIFFLPALRKRVLIIRIRVTHVNSHLN
ncbi:Protein CBG26970 [Caenorhabditis briggsae]|uniref:Protein CBG26970 n=1 Tax=Caenorhabditis briggsae TaxID=6238 RepID=B6IET6_CAEBR|nr:Protein CBG26970 [Caenorhabditis briggsae]CAR98416.1 Protein CBG26970 [Caenorhabditis briggsae]